MSLLLTFHADSSWEKAFLFSVTCSFFKVDYLAFSNLSLSAMPQHGYDTNIVWLALPKDFSSLDSVLNPAAISFPAAVIILFSVICFL